MRVLTQPGHLTRGPLGDVDKAGELAMIPFSRARDIRLELWAGES